MYRGVTPLVTPRAMPSGEIGKRRRREERVSGRRGEGNWGRGVRGRESEMRRARAEDEAAKDEDADIDGGVGGERAAGAEEERRAHYGKLQGKGRGT